MVSVVSLSRFIGWIATLGVVATAAVALAAPVGVSYPVAELGDCRDAKECALYCEVPAHYLDCWYWDVVSGPRVLQATTAEQTVSIAGQEMTLAEAAKFCENPASQNDMRACLDAAAVAGVEPELPPEYVNAAQQIGVVPQRGTDEIALMKAAMERFAQAEADEQTRFEQTAVAGLSEDVLPPPFRVVKAMQERGFDVRTVSEAASECRKEENRVMCHFMFRETRTGGGYTGAFGQLVQQFAKRLGDEQALAPGLTPKELARRWEQISEEKRKKIIEAAETGFVREFDRAAPRHVSEKAKRCYGLQYPERAECFKGLFREETGRDEYNNHPCKELDYPERALCFKREFQEEGDAKQRPGSECEQLAYPERAECFKRLQPGGEDGTAVPADNVSFEQNVHEQMSDYPKPMNYEMYEQAQQEGQELPPYKKVFGVPPPSGQYEQDEQYHQQEGQQFEQYSSGEGNYQLPEGNYEGYEGYQQ